MEFRISKVNQTRSYWVILGWFVAANVGTALRFFATDAACCDQLLSIGFPFPLYVSGGPSSGGQLLVTGLLLDIVIAWTLAIAGAWISLSWQRRRQRDSES